MLRTFGTFGLSIICCLISFSQDSVCVIRKGQLLKYRKGYIITVKDDTIHGLIYHESDTGIMFISAGKKIKTTGLGKHSRIPYIPASYNIIKAFYRNGIFYKRCKIPPDGSLVYLALLENGPLKLYADIRNYADKAQADAMINQQMMGGLLGAYITEANEEKDIEAEYYDLHSYYIQKDHAENLVYVPKGEQNFKKVFLPLIRDNNIFVKELYGQPINYYQTRSLVQRYNSITNK